VTAPVHRVKILLQTSNISAGKHSSSAWGRSVASIADTLHCYRTVLADGGFRNLCVSTLSSFSIKICDRPCLPTVASHAALLRYHGYSVQLAVESFGRGAYFAAYEICKQYLSKDMGDVLLPLHYRIASGACAGLVGW
jgi:hypothetical protein